MAAGTVRSQTVSGMTVQDFLDKIADLSRDRWVNWSKVPLVLGLYPGDFTGWGDWIHLDSPEFLSPEGEALLALFGSEGETLEVIEDDEPEIEASP